MENREYTLKEFLENVPPSKMVIISDKLYESPYNEWYFTSPEVYVYCESEECKGLRYFAPSSNRLIADTPTDSNDVFIVYTCKNCGKFVKTFALNISFLSDKWRVFKYGEFPIYGLPTPSRAIKLIGPDKELFLMGRRCENQGMGIGAFVYYRRVVENQKNRIFDEIIKVTKVISPNDELISELEAAKKETQFSRAIEWIKHGLPQSLLINGHNPLLLLHSALSEGVHNDNDATCLELATSIRVVLIEFAERIGQALKDEAELTEAVKRLASKRNKNNLNVDTNM